MSTKTTNPKDRAASLRLDLSLFPDTAVAYGALAMTEGDAKYGGYNFRVDGVLSSVYYAAARRHLIKWFAGEESDATTGVPHLASALASIGILIDARVCGKLNDDRPPSFDAAKMLKEMEATVACLHTLYPDGKPRKRQDALVPVQGLEDRRKARVQRRARGGGNPSQDRRKVGYGLRADDWVAHLSEVK